MSSAQRFDTSALAGLRVADFSRVLAGPYASMMLGDLGADVIKIESPLGDDTRQWVPPVDHQGQGTYFASVNRNKRSIVCDLRTDAGLMEAQRLALSADVVIENFRPGTMARFGLGYEQLILESPRLVYCSITGFGAGAGAKLPGYDLLVQAVGGLMSLTGEPDGGPTKVGVALVDVLTGLNATVGIQAALLAREHTGTGQHVEVNLMSSLLSALVNQASSTLATGTSPVRMGNFHPSISPYESFATEDGVMVIAIGNDKQFRSLATVLGIPEVATDMRFSTNERRVEHRKELHELLERSLEAAPREHWVELMTRAGTPAGPVNDVGTAFEFAESLGLKSVINIQKDGRSSRHVANPITLSRTPVSYRALPPALGEHQAAQWLARVDSPTCDSDHN